MCKKWKRILILRRNAAAAPAAKEAPVAVDTRATEVKPEPVLVEEAEAEKVVEESAPKEEKAAPAKKATKKKADRPARRTSKK